jgi:hypothetical protein
LRAAGYGEDPNARQRCRSYGQGTPSRPL